MSTSASTCRSTHRAVADTLDVIGGKWKLVILSALLERTYRFKELGREIGISPRILSKELQELEQHQLITRTVCNTRPITVEYAATAYCRTLQTVIGALSEWGMTHHQTIVGKPRSGTTASPV
ncbi:winged helix-turn-helix transcriptional regulator [Hymenobacter crusticola]|uniref:HxlR family transcriptional regulator n=1 Tax=Hymenobacter crusticola TaxID=1770526 RepID=A0A243W7P9_9BACT|nr:helix-turn-helix domain-containing protein [Hymenobacter crusticola]OUJ71063.1 HxlR family transcriptional regulator [Hymenobacter crusticola]